MTEPIATRLEEAGYGVGSLASASFATVPGLILLYYLTDVLAVPAAIAGVILFVPKLFDVIVNPLVGRLSDRTRTRFGARRPWILGGGIVFPLAFVATFWTPYSGTAAAIWVGLSFTAASLAFSAFVVPWSSLPAEIAPNARARTSMAAWRIGFLAVAVLASGGLAPLIVADAQDVRSGYRHMALAIGCMMVVAVLLVVLIGARRSTPSTTRPASAAGFRAWLAMLRASPPLCAMFWLVGGVEFASALSLAGIPYLADHVLGDIEVVTPMFIVLTATLLVTMPMWRRAAARTSKHIALKQALLTFAAGAFILASLLLVPPAMKLPVAFAAIFINAIGLAGTTLLAQSMFADVLAYETAIRGETMTGAMVGAWNAAETLSGGLGAASFAIMLALTGFASNGSDGTGPQDAAITGIIVAISFFPAMAALGARFAVRGFTLTEADVDEATRSSAF